VLARLREKDVQEMMTKFAMEVEAGNLLPGQAARAVIRRIEELK